MKPKKEVKSNQEDLFRNKLENIIDKTHPLCQLSEKIEWAYFEKEFAPLYSDKGRCAKSVRLLIALHYLKHMYNESDESVVERFLENPYWQYFAGYEYFQHTLPLDATTLVKWRNRLGSENLEKVFVQTLKTAVSMGVLKGSHLNRVNVDTTVQEKAIAFPTDARLYHKLLTRLVKESKERGIDLRQSYKRVSKKALAKQGRYAHAGQYKRARRETKRLKTYLGRVSRDIQRKVDKPDSKLKDYLYMSDKLLLQEKSSKHKLYSIHEPHVECISKGKAHKRYEFGCKVSVATTSRANWVIGVQAHHGNPYDGHTLEEMIAKIEEGAGRLPKHVYCDRGYRGHAYEGSANIHIVGQSRGRKKTTLWEKMWRRRRSAIEPVIGHLKQDNRMGRNFLKGMEGDRINAILAAAAANMRKLYLVFFLTILYWRKKAVDWGKICLFNQQQSRSLVIV